MPWGSSYWLLSWAHIFLLFFSFMTVLDIVSLEFVRLKERKSSCNGQTLTMERSRKRQGKCSSWGSNRSTAANKKEEENVHLVRHFPFSFFFMDGPNVLFFLSCSGWLPHDRGLSRLDFLFYFLFPLRSAHILFFFYYWMSGSGKRKKRKKPGKPRKHFLN